MSKKDNTEIEEIKEEKKILPAGSLPQSVLDINKKYKTTKITTLDKAKSFILKRMFSGSILMDELSGGGWGYKRIHLLFGGRSAGKNALLNQTIAYNQRLCRHCMGILPHFYNGDDRHAMFLKYVLNVQECKCDNSESKKFFVLDYEKSLAIEDSKIIIIRDITDNKSGEKVIEEYYEEQIEKFNLLTEKENLQENEQIELKVMEKWFKNLTIESNEIFKESTTDYLIKCGVLINELLVADPPDIEDGTEMIINMIREAQVDGIILDSIQAAFPRRVKDRNSADETMGVEAKANGLLLRHVCSSFAANDLTNEREAYKPAFFITSQLRSSIGGFVTKQDTYSGGNALHHLTDIAVELKREGFLKIDGTDSTTFKDDFYGQKVRLRTDKNKLAAPGGMQEYNYYFKDADNYKVGEIDHISEIITLGVEKGRIERAGAYYTLSTGDKFQGMQKLVEFCRSNPEFIGKVYKNIKG